AHQRVDQIRLTENWIGPQFAGPPLEPHLDVILAARRRGQIAGQSSYLGLSRWPLSTTAQAIQRGCDEEVEGDHAGDRITWQSEDRLVIGYRQNRGLAG